MFKSELWRKLQILGVVLSVAGFILVLISQIRSEVPPIWWDGWEFYVSRISEITPISGKVYYIGILTEVYPFSWLMLPAVVFLTIGIVSIIYGHLVKRTYG